MNDDTKPHTQKLEHERLKSQAEFSNIFEKSKIEKAMKLEVKQLQISQALFSATSHHNTSDKKYNPRLPVYQAGENFVIF